MRIIIGLIFFALLFYGIWVYYPDTFQTLVSWDAKTFNYLRDMVLQLQHAPSTPPPPAEPAPKALLIFISRFFA